MPNQSLQFENLLESVNDFANQLGQVAGLTEGFDGGVKRPYLAFALHMLLSSEASKRLGAGWYLLVIRSIVSEIEYEFTTTDEFDDFVDKFFSLFEEHNIQLDEAVINELNIAFDMYDQSLDLVDTNTDSFDN